MRLAEVRQRLEKLRILSSDTGVISGESAGGYKWSRLSSDTSVANIQPIFRPNTRRHSSRAQRNIQTVILYPKCKYNRVSTLSSSSFGEHVFWNWFWLSLWAVPIFLKGF